MMFVSAKIRFLALSVAAVALAVGSFAQGDDAAKKPIVIGVGAPMTGRSAAFGTQVRYGVETAVKELNAKGGLLGRPVKAIIKDDASNANDAAIVAQSYAGDPNVVAVVGHFNSDCSSAAKKIYSAAGMVMFSPASTNETVTQNTDWVFRNIFNDRDQGFALAHYVSEAMKKKKVAILYENDTYGKGLQEDFNKKAKELGLDVVADISYETDSTDFRPLLNQIKAKDPEVLVTCGLYKSGATIVREARELGIRAPLIGGDGMFDNELAKIGGKAAEGYLASAPFLVEAGGEAGKKLAEDIKKQYGEEGDAWAALAYDAAMIIAKAIENGNSADRKSIRDQIAAMNSIEKAFPGVTGKTYFDAEGDTKKRVLFAVVKDGKFVLAKDQLPE